MSRVIVTKGDPSTRANLSDLIPRLHWIRYLFMSVRYQHGYQLNLKEAGFYQLVVGHMVTITNILEDRCRKLLLQRNALEGVAQRIMRR